MFNYLRVTDLPMLTNNIIIWYPVLAPYHGHRVHHNNWELIVTLLTAGYCKLVN